MRRDEYQINEDSWMPQIASAITINKACIDHFHRCLPYEILGGQWIWLGLLIHLLKSRIGSVLASIKHTVRTFLQATTKDVSKLGDKQMHF